ncbi:MAG: YfhO family protein, partial [Bryobacteraceae bacterium]
NYYGSFQFNGTTWNLPWNPTWLYLYVGIGGLACVAAALGNRRAAPYGIVTLLGSLWMLGDNTPVGRGVFAVLPEIVKAPLYAEYALPIYSAGMAVLAGLGAQRLMGARRAALQAAAVAVVAGELIAVGSGRPMNTTRFEDEPGVTREHFDGVREIPERMRELTSRATPPWRVDTRQGSINWSLLASLMEVPTATGNEPLALERLMRVRLLFAKGERWGRWYEVDDPASPVLDLLNVKYILSKGIVDKERMEPARFVKIAGFPGNEVWENAEALPRFFLVGRIRQAGGIDEAVAALRAIDPRVEAVVEGAATGPLGGGGTVRVARYARREVELDVDATGAAFLVTSEAHYPGWRAWVDGEERELRMTNVAFRGLEVPAGRHRVRMRFEPPILRWATALSAAGWLALLVVCLRRLR